MRVCVCACLFFLFIPPFLLLHTDYLSLLRLLFNFDIAFTHFVEKMRIQNTEKFRKREFRNKTRNQNKKSSNKDK